MSLLSSLILHLSPALPKASIKEVIRAPMGAALGVAVCAGFALYMPLVAGFSLGLIAPLGASAVLIFTVPNSPLAQPWSAMMGNMISAVIAILVLWSVPHDLAPAIAVGGAIMAMMLVRALHPPGAAVALMATLDPVPVLEAGLAYAVVPVGVMTAALVLCGVAYNRPTGRVYPFRHVTAPQDEIRLGLSSDELGELLRRFNQSTNIGVADLGRLLAAAEEEAAHHRFDGVTCADIMNTDLICVEPGATLGHIARLFRKHAIKSLPVIDEAGVMKGVIVQSDLVNALLRLEARPLFRMSGRDSLRATDVMRPPNQAVAHDLPVGVLLNRFALRGVSMVPVTRAGRLVGILTRSDIIALLLKGATDRAAA